MPGSAISDARHRGELAAVPLARRARGGVQMMRAAVVAEPAHSASTLVDGAAASAAIGKRATKRSKYGSTGRDLGLLQHDLGEPDAIGVARVLPRQVVAAVRALPRHDARCERGKA